MEKVLIFFHNIIMHISFNPETQHNAMCWPIKNDR